MCADNGKIRWIKIPIEEKQLSTGSGNDAWRSLRALWKIQKPKVYRMQMSEVILFQQFQGTVPSL